MGFVPVHPFSKELLYINRSDVNLVIRSLNFLKKSFDQRIIKDIEPLIKNKDENIRRTAWEAIIAILHWENPEEAFKIIIKELSIMPENYASLLETETFELSKESLLLALKEGSQNVRAFSGQYMLKHKMLNAEIARMLLNDSDSIVRKIGFEWLLNNGENFSFADIEKYFPKPKNKQTFLGSLSSKEVTEDEIIPLLLSKKDFSELEKMVDFYDSRGKDAYEALALHCGEKIAPILRMNLSDHCDSLVKKSDEKRINISGGLSTYLPLVLDKDVDDFWRDSFVAISLKGLLNYCVPDDIEFARKYLGKTKYGMGDNSCIQIIKKYGNQTDVNRLLEFSKDKNTDIMQAAIEVALKLSHNKKEIFQTLAVSDDKRMVGIVVKLLDVLDESEQIDYAKKYLYYDDDEVRLLASNVLSKLLNHNQLEEILDEYINASSYYYNVVHYFDRIIYSFKEISIDTVTS